MAKLDAPEDDNESAVPPAPAGSETLLSELLNRKPQRRLWLRLLLLGVQSFILTMIAVLIAVGLGLEQGGVLSVFLAATSLVVPFNILLTENARSIWVWKQGFWTSNRRTLRSLVALFLGMSVAYFAAGLWLEPAALAESFSALLTISEIDPDLPLSRRFGGFGGLLGHNLAVATTFFLLAVMYRSYGALLAVGWNACVWGVTLSLLVEYGARRSDLTPVVFAFGALGAILPHLILEAASYVLCAMAGVFASRGLTKYDSSDRRLGQVVKACGALLVIGLLLLLAAGLFEAFFAPWILRYLETGAVVTNFYIR